MSSDEENDAPGPAKKTCGPQVCKAQQEIYVIFLEENAEFCDGRLTGSYTRENYANDWTKLLLKLNAVEGGARKTSEKWRKSFADWKQTVKRKASNILIHSKGTGGGPPLQGKSSFLSDLEERFHRLFGGEIAVSGDPDTEEGGFGSSSHTDDIETTFVDSRRYDLFPNNEDDHQNDMLLGGSVVAAARSAAARSVAAASSEDQNLVMVLGTSKRFAETNMPPSGRTPAASASRARVMASPQTPVSRRNSSSYNPTAGPSYSPAGASSSRPGPSSSSAFRTKVAYRPAEKPKKTDEISLLLNKIHQTLETLVVKFEDMASSVQGQLVSQTSIAQTLLDLSTVYQTINDLTIIRPATTHEDQEQESKDSE